MKRKITLCAFVLLAILAGVKQSSFAQCIDCGTGTDGAFIANNNTSITGNTYHFSSFTINAGVTVTVTGNSPLIIYCTGAVTINGTLTASGGNGQNGITFSTFGIGGIGVAGGANGGDGVYLGSASPGSNGFGTGAGGGGAGWSGGGGGGYSANGANSGGIGGFGGISYGNVQINPIVAGSGGGGGSGGNSCGSGGGGAGGGIIFIATCGTLSIGAGGSILCNGGNGGTDGGGNCGGGGGGSGGSVWLVANTLNNAGAVSAVNGIGGTTTIPNAPLWGNGGVGANGRVRLDYISITGTGTVNPPAGYILALAIIVNITSAPAICMGDCITLSVQAAGGNGAPYTYLWNPSSLTGQNPTVCPDSTTSYTCVATDSLNCSGSATVTVTVHPLPVLSLSAQGDTVCINSTFNTLFGTPAGGNYFGTGVGGNNFNSVIAGAGAHNVSYRYTESVNGCTDTITISIFVDLCTGVEEFDVYNDVTIFPNPAVNQLAISNRHPNASGAISSIEIIDLPGKIVLGKQPSTHSYQLTVDVSAVPAGMYFVRVQTERGIVMRKILIAR